MAKASIRLADGALVQIDGTPEEIARLLALYGGKPNSPAPDGPATTKRAKVKAASPQIAADGVSAGPNLSQIVNLIKTCDEAEAIEAKILDNISQLDRILLPLYIIYRHLNNALGLTSGEINQITKELGTPVSQPNASSTLSGTASKYVIGDKVRKKGQPVRYKLSRRGFQYLSGILVANS